MHVLVTGGRAPATLELVRALHRRGHVVHAAESVGGTLTSLSRCVTRRHRVRAPIDSHDGFVDDLASIVREHAIDVVIPTCEEAMWVARGRASLEPYARVATFTYDAMVRLHGKASFARYVADLGYRAPATRRVTRLHDLLDAVRRPVVVKPDFSRFGTHVRVRPDPPGYGTPADDRFWREVRIDEGHPWVVQEYLDGPHLSSWSVVRDGRVVAHTTYPATFTAAFARRSRDTAGSAAGDGAPAGAARDRAPAGAARDRAPAGATVTFEHVDVEPLERLARDVARSVGGSGMLAFDAVVVDGVPVPIECNPRLTSGVHLFHDQPVVADLLACDDPVDESVGQRPLTPRLGARASLTYPLSLYGASQVLDRPGSWPAWLRALAARDATFWWRDPLPTVLQPWVLASTYARAFRHGVGPLQATTLDIEWNGPAWHDEAVR